MSKKSFFPSFLVDLVTLYSTPVHFFAGPCVGGCWDWTKNCCKIHIESHSRSPLGATPGLLILLFVTWIDESRPPCRRVADNGRPSSVCCSNCCRSCFPPLLCENVVVSLVLVLLFAEYYSLLYFSFHFSCTEVAVRIFLQLVELKLPLEGLLGRGPFFTVSGKRFHGSTTLTLTPFYWPLRTVTSVRIPCVLGQVIVNQGDVGFVWEANMLLGGHEVAKVSAAAAAQVRPRLRVLPDSGHRKNRGQIIITFFTLTYKQWHFLLEAVVIIQNIFGRRILAMSQSRLQRHT